VCRQKAGCQAGTAADPTRSNQGPRRGGTRFAALAWSHTHLAHGLRVGGGGGEVAVPVEAAKQAAPAVVAVGGVGQAPGHQRLALWEEGRGG
jgi:hypothetical protein